MTDQPAPFGIQNVEQATTYLEITKREWSLRVRSAIRDQLREHGTYCSNDLDHLDIPAEIRSTIFGTQTNAAVRAGLMVRVGQTKATRPESHGREVKTFRITDHGRAELCAGVGADVGTGINPDPGDWTSTRPAESSLPVDDRHQKPEPGPSSPPSDGPGSPTSTAQDNPPAEPEQLSLITGEPADRSGPGHIDIDQRKAA